jgi:methylisocitrate lyase
MTRAHQLRQLLADTDDRAFVIPGVGTPLEARSAERAGFAAVYLSGYAVAAWRHGLPDIGLLGARDTADALTAVARVTTVPVICDADTGYGDVPSVHANVRLLEAAGAAAIQIEDQTWPKKCGHMVDKEVIDADDAVRKIEAAVAARTDPDTVIVARTDSLAPLGLDEALARARRFKDAGADVLFVDAPQSMQHLEVIGKQLPGSLMANQSEGGLTPPLSATELHALGFTFVVFPTSALRVAALSIDQMMKDLRVHEDTRSWRDRMYGLDELNELVDLAHYNDLESVDK